MVLLQFKKNKDEMINKDPMSLTFQYFKILHFAFEPYTNAAKEISLY